MTWAVVFQNAHGQRLPQETSSFELAWALSQPPPQQTDWIQMTKQQAELLFELGLTHVCVATKNKEKRFIYRI